MTDPKRTSNTSPPQGQLRYYIGERGDCLRIMKRWFSRPLTKKEVYTLCGAPPRADVFVGTLADSLYFEFYDNPDDTMNPPTEVMTGAMCVTEDQNSRSLSLIVYSYGTLRPMYLINGDLTDSGENEPFHAEKLLPSQLHLCHQLGITKILMP